jgi:protein-disulfide isomerase
MSIVRTFDQVVAGVVLACGLSAVGCHGQVPAAGAPLSPDTARRIEILIRQRAKITPDDTLVIGPRQPSEIPGYDKIEVIFTTGGVKSQPNTFLLSKDGNTLAQFNKYDIGKDPKTIVSASGRPSRGGPAGAPVELVMFDDLECPFCAKMHKQLFPALTNRYGQTVHVVYRDFPLSQHPWAMRAAVDTNCVGAQSTQGYWNLVDYIHAHANDFGGAEHSLQKANDALDQMALDQAKTDGLKPEQVSAVEACVKKQDQTEIKASVKLGESLDIEATPVLFINGEKLEGAYPLEDVFRMVDQALVAAGKVPPPAYAAPSTGPAKAGN